MACGCRASPTGGRTLHAAAGRRPALRPDRTGHGRGPRQAPAAPAQRHESKRVDEPGAFARLEEGIQEFTRDISGAGFDVPAWLEALEQEVDRVLSDGPEEEELPDPQLPVVQVRLTREEVRRQVQAMGTDGKGKMP